MQTSTVREEIAEILAELQDKKLCAEIALARRKYQRTGGVPADDIINKYK
jgi:hypothetical protein